MDDERTLRALGRVVRDASGTAVTAEHDAAEQARLLDALREPARSSRLRWTAGLALAAALAILVVVLVWPRAPLRYSIEGARTAESGYVSAPSQSPAVVRFSDGSVATLGAGSGARIIDVTPKGARILLEDGSADVEISPRDGARWSIEAGPYVVLVTGTRFEVLWRSGPQRLEVRLLEGNVVVRGPLLEDGVSVRAGQVLVADARNSHVHLEETASASAGAPSATPAPTAAAGQPSTTPEPDPAPTAAPLSWSKRVAAGDFQGVLAEAEQLGFDSVLEQGSLERVVALGDAARYGKRGDLARKALSALRRRFPTSSQGRSAAYLLGRQLDDGGSAGAAISWYETYLSESPGGTFAVEALGRRMWAVSRTRGKDAARPLAEDYLRRYSTGPHASVARSILAR
jgi:hypothetical protein